jgi:hypothetical protein
MLVFTDVLNGAEILSEAFPMKLVDNAVWEVEAAMIDKQLGGNFDIGANASAEEAPEDLEEGVEKVNNVVDAGQLAPASPMDKKAYGAYLKKYMKKVKANVIEWREKELARVGALNKTLAEKKLLTEDTRVQPEFVYTDEEIKEFEVGAGAYFKKIGKDFDAYELYEPESHAGEENGMYVLLNFREDGVTPYLCFWKLGLRGMKV